MSSPAPAPDSAATAAQLGRRASKARYPHRVQFYDRDDHLYQAVGAHLAAGLMAGDPVVMIATEEHRRQVETWLGEAGHDVDAARCSGQLVMLDAREALATFMVDGLPSWDLFLQHIGGLIERCSRFRSGGRPWAYGEMVDVLWREGNTAAALRLEQYWNDLSHLQAFSLLCGYAMDNFREAADAGGLELVCHCHTEVEPAESFEAEAGAVGLNRQVVLLQQRSRALQTELDHRRQLEGELWRQHSVLSRTARFGELFVGTLGHDLRSPLLAMVTAAGLLLRRFDAGDVNRLAQRILTSAGRMDRMIDQLLDFTRIRLGQGLPLTRRNVDLRVMCHEVLEETRRVDHRPVLIDARGDTSGCWDRDRLGQLVFCLMENALTHGSQDQPVSVSVDGTARDQVAVEVCNAGEIPLALQPLLFEPFKVEATKQVGVGGLGLGLFLTEQIAIAHGGDIRVVSSRENGTRFSVRLPRVVAEA